MPSPSGSGVPTTGFAGRVAVDLAVYGATPAGLATAIVAAERGLSVEVAVVTGTELGGMMAGGLGWDDVLGVVENDTALVYGNASVYIRFTSLVLAHYRGISPLAANLSHHGTRHEPAVARAIFSTMLAAAGVTVWGDVALQAVELGANGAIASMVLVDSLGDSRSTRTVLAKVYADGTYLGDLLAATGAPFRVGRESRREFGELNAGVVYTMAAPNGGSVFIQGSTGAASPRIPAMSWRVCFSSDPANSVVPLSPPPGYNRSLYLGYLADFAAGRIESVFDAWSTPRPLPPDGTKFDMNCNPRPLGFVWVGPQKELIVSANTTRRAELVDELRTIALGLLYFQQTDSEVPKANRVTALGYGLCKDEFPNNDHFPTQL